MPEAVFETHLAVLCATASLIQTLARKVLRFWATKTPLRPGDGPLALTFR
jgi:hypothetical protein